MGEKHDVFDGKEDEWMPWLEPWREGQLVGLRRNFLYF